MNQEKTERDRNPDKIVIILVATIFIAVTIAAASLVSYKIGKDIGQGNCDSNEVTTETNDTGNDTDNQDIDSTYVYYNEDECIANGGKWDILGLSNEEGCNLPSDDAGNVCTSNDDCESYCIAQDEGSSDTQLTGKCYEYQMRYGCFDIVEDNQVINLCVD